MKACRILQGANGPGAKRAGILQIEPCGIGHQGNLRDAQFRQRLHSDRAIGMGHFNLEACELLIRSRELAIAPVSDICGKGLEKKRNKARPAKKNKTKCGSFSGQDRPRAPASQSLFPISGLLTSSPASTCPFTGFLRPPCSFAKALGQSGFRHSRGLTNGRPFSDPHAAWL